MAKVPQKNSRELEMALRHVAQMASGRRKLWKRQSMFFLSCLEFCSGFGNLWRFPWVLYKNGGGVFFIPYIIMLILVAQPMLVAESVLGQFTGLRPVEALTIIPVSEGVGVSVLVICFFVSVYYSIVIVYVSRYLVETFFWPLSWMKCDEWWGADEACFTASQASRMNISFDKDTCSPSNLISEQFWRNRILHLADDISLENVGSIEYELAGLLFGVWTVIFLWKIRGVSRMRKMVYLSAPIPFLALIILLVLSHFLPGAFVGFQYIFRPQWKRLLTMEIWHSAMAQLLFSLGLGLGGIIVYNSFKTFDSRIFKYVYTLSVIDFLTSTIATFASFAVIGSLAYRLGISVDDVVRAGPGLMFVVMAEVLVPFPLPNIIGGFSYFMFLFFGFGSQFVFVEVILVSCTDIYPLWKKWRVYLCLGLCLASLGVGLAFTTKGGIYILEFFDKFIIEVALIFVAFSEIFIITYVYGALRFGDDIDFMTNRQPHLLWKLTWVLTAPLGLLTSFLFGVIVLDYSTFDCKPYSSWMIAFGWFLVALCLLPIPCCCIWKLRKFSKMEVGTTGAFLPNAAWGPPDFVTRVRYKGWRLTIYPDPDMQPGLGARLGFRGSALPPTVSTVILDGQRVTLPSSTREMRRSERLRRLRRRQSSLASVLVSVMRVPPPHQVLNKTVPLHSRVAPTVAEAPDSLRLKPTMMLISEKEMLDDREPSPSSMPQRRHSPREERLRKASLVYEKVTRSVSWLSSKYSANQVDHRHTTTAEILRQPEEKLEL